MILQAPGDFDNGPADLASSPNTTPTVPTIPATDFETEKKSIDSSSARFHNSKFRTDLRPKEELVWRQVKDSSEN